MSPFCENIFLQCYCRPTQVETEKRRTSSTVPVANPALPSMQEVLSQYIDKDAGGDTTLLRDFDIDNLQQNKGKRVF